MPGQREQFGLNHRRTQKENVVRLEFGHTWIELSDIASLDALRAAIEVI